MEFPAEYEGNISVIADIFNASFTASEGSKEGELIGELAHRLMEETPQEDLRVFTAWNNGELDGAIIFSSLTFEGDKRAVFVFGPVAVATKRQGKISSRDWLPMASRCFNSRVLISQRLMAILAFMSALGSRPSLKKCARALSFAAP